MELSKVIKRLKEKGFALVMTEEAKDLLIEKGTSLEYGARPLRRAIESLLEDPLAEDLLRGVYVGKDLIQVKVTGEGEDRKLLLDAVTAETPALVGAQ
jgi:ATP-dependent Clp protease ATP-binding subunit ClpC